MAEGGIPNEKLGGAPASKQALRLWLRLLTCTALIERRVAARLREEFATTLPRFDVLSALERAGPNGLTLGEVSRMLMVTNGNVTALAARLSKDGLIEAVSMPDRRFQRMRLTRQGEQTFARWAEQHETWIETMLQDLTDIDTRQLFALLDHLKQSLLRNDAERRQT